MRALFLARAARLPSFAFASAARLPQLQRPCAAAGSRLALHTAPSPASALLRCRPRPSIASQILGGGSRRQLATATPPPPPNEKEKKPSRWEKLKATFREHGAVFVCWYTVNWASGFACCWGAVTFFGLDGVALLQQLGADSVIDTTALSPRLINAFIAAEINELIDLVRLPMVIATTPAVGRKLKSWRGVPVEAPATDATDEAGSAKGAKGTARKK